MGLQGGSEWRREREVYLARRISGSAWWVAIVVAVVLQSAVAAPWLAAQDSSTGVPDPRSIRTFGEKLKVPGVPNAGKVNDLLYRGAQPRPAGYEQLKHLGVTMVVDLRNTGPKSPERQAVEAQGMRYVSIATSAYFGPTDHQVATFLQLLRDNPKEKTFVHCYFGDDRTGVMIAAYRIAEEHWSADQAYNEMRFFHFHTYLLLMAHYIKRFPGDFASSPEFTEIRGASPKS
jgi:tyrosine-protein phosphatase SIW14